MISAKSAYEQTRKNIVNKVDAEAKRVEQRISKAIKDCKYSVTIDGVISKETEDWLMGLGYCVQSGNQYNETYTCIKWS